MNTYRNKTIGLASFAAATRSRGKKRGGCFGVEVGFCSLTLNRHCTQLVYNNSKLLYACVAGRFRSWFPAGSSPGGRRSPPFPSRALPLHPLSCGASRPRLRGLGFRRSALKLRVRASTPRSLQSGRVFIRDGT